VSVIYNQNPLNVKSTRIDETDGQYLARLIPQSVLVRADEGIEEAHPDICCSAN
jgi:hypothetical protein